MQSSPRGKRNKKRFLQEATEITERFLTISVSSVDSCEEMTRDERKKGSGKEYRVKMQGAESKE
jgi:hypothetical protein